MRVDLYIRDVASSPTHRSWRRARPRASAISERLFVIHMTNTHTQKKTAGSFDAG